MKPTAVLLDFQIIPLAEPHSKLEITGGTAYSSLRVLALLLMLPILCFSARIKMAATTSVSEAEQNT